MTIIQTSNEEKTVTVEDPEPTFADMYPDHFRNPSEVVDSLLDSSSTALTDPIELVAAADVVAALTLRISEEVAEPFALYDPRQVGSILGDFASALYMMVDAMPKLDAAVARMQERGEIPADAIAAWSASMSTDVLKHAASILGRSAKNHATLPYNGYMPVTDDEHQGVLIAELERRGIVIDEWAPRRPLPDGGQSVAYIDFTYAGRKCEIRSEEGWEVRIITDDDEVLEIGARWGYSPTIHPESLVAVDRYVAEQAATGPAPREA